MILFALKRFEMAVSFVSDFWGFATLRRAFPFRNEFQQKYRTRHNVMKEN